MSTEPVLVHGATRRPIRGPSPARRPDHHRDRRLLAADRRLTLPGMEPLNGGSSVYKRCPRCSQQEGVGSMPIFKLLFGGSPWVRRLARLGDEAPAADSGKLQVAEVVRHMAFSHAGLLFVIAVALYAAIIVDMVLKPF